MSVRWPWPYDGARGGMLKSISSPVSTANCLSASANKANQPRIYRASAPSPIRGILLPPAPFAQVVPAPGPTPGVLRRSDQCLTPVCADTECPWKQAPFFVAFGYSEDALCEIGAFFKKGGKSIIALTVQDILDEQIACKLA